MKICKITIKLEDARVINEELTPNQYLQLLDPNFEFHEIIFKWILDKTLYATKFVVDTDTGISQFYVFAQDELTEIEDKFNEMKANESLSPIFLDYSEEIVSEEDAVAHFRNADLSANEAVRSRSTYDTRFTL